MVHSSPLSHLIPEIYPIIVSHLPLYLTPATLLALTLTNHHISEIVLPILHSRLILKNENDALKMIERLLTEPDLGKLVREIHILSDLSLATIRGENPFDVLSGLLRVISGGLIPFMHTLGLHLCADSFSGYGSLGFFRASIWVSLRRNCPRLRALILKGVIDDSSLYGAAAELPDVTNLTLNFDWFTSTYKGWEPFSRKLRSLSHNLHTLDLHGLNKADGLIFPLLTLTFPKLLSLDLAGSLINKSPKVIAFLDHHPTLEYLDISPASRDVAQNWFPDDFVVEAGFLPNLKHLKCHFKDARCLAPILHQLKSMSLYKSVNAQVPYLLRSILPSGLPNLRSLSIKQINWTPKNEREIEGALWYETEDGNFHENVRSTLKPGKEIWENYIHSLTRGAPNLEEFGLDIWVSPSAITEFPKFPFELGKFSKLRRFYLRRRYGRIRGDLLWIASVLGKECRTLDMVFDLYDDELPYHVAKIGRDKMGTVLSVVPGLGYGMQIGHEDEAFPI